MTSLHKPQRAAINTVLPFVFQHWRKQPWRVAGVCAALSASTLADVFMPFFAGRLVDAVSAGATDAALAWHNALWAFAAIVMLGLVAVVLRHIGFQAIVALTLRIMSDVGRDAFWRVQRFATDWHANSFSGSTVRKVTRGMSALDLLNDTILAALMPSLVVLIGSMLLLGSQWPALGVVLGLGTIAYIALTAVVSTRYIAPAARASNSWDTRLGGVLADSLGCNAVVKAFGAEQREDGRLAGTLRQWARRTGRTWRRYTRAGTAQLLLLLGVRVAVIGGALVLWQAGRATAGDVAYVMTTYFVIHGYLRDIGMHINNLQRSVNDMDELVQLHAQPIGVADAPEATAIAVRGGGITFDDVTFHYGRHTTPLYRGLSVTIRPGERVGLVGRSGSGKTTFVKLIQRLHDVNAGCVLIDGQDVRHATQQSLRSQIAIVQQEPVLFHRTIAENIAYARPDASQADIEQAARLANAHDFITRLPDGYATLVGERGVKLSGGERQRVALARAFLADAPILILDEATSSLDSESEALIQDAMERLIQGRTALVIAHRLSTVRALDRILVFDRGAVVEDGNHASLLRHEEGIYRKLFERQSSDGQVDGRPDGGALVAAE